MFKWQAIDKTNRDVPRLRDKGRLKGAEEEGGEGGGIANTKTKEVLPQRAKKVVSDSPGLVDFAIGLVNSVFNLPDGQVMFFEEFK